MRNGKSVTVSKCIAGKKTGADSVSRKSSTVAKEKNFFLPRMSPKTDLFATNESKIDFVTI